MATRARDDQPRNPAQAGVSLNAMESAPSNLGNPAVPAREHEVCDGPAAVLRRPGNVLALVLLLILGYTAVTRLEGLGRKPYHHDESIHALHSYNLYRGEGWQYDPVYHGPVVYYFNALAYFLFGDSNYTGRLMPGLFGVLLVVLALALGRELGKLESMYIAGFIALSPTLYYFSRFVRDDIYGACWTVMMVIGYLRYRRTGNWRWLHLCVVGLAMAFCSKINALIIGFTFCSSLVLYAVWESFFGRPPSGTGTEAPRTRMQRLKDILVRHHLVARSLLVFGGVVLAVAAYVVVFLPSYPAKGPSRPWYWATSLCLLGAALWLLDRWIQRSGGDRDESLSTQSLYQRHRPVILFTLVFMVIFGLLYTNFLKLVPLPGGRDVSIGTLLGSAFTDGLHYWYGQQLHPRIADVWYYYVPRIIVYELPLAILVILGSFVRLSDRQRGVLIVGLLLLVVLDSLGLASGTLSPEQAAPGTSLMEWACYLGLVLVGGFLAWEDLRQSRPERALLVYWAVLAFIVYAKANEKVPWLGVHVVLPLTFYGGALAADLHRHLRATGGAGTRRWAAGLGVLSLLYYLHAGLILNVHNEADPREIMVYVQSTTDVLDVVHELEDIAYHDGTYYDTKFTIEDEASWPLSWYLRHYRSVAYLPTISNLDGGTAAVLTKSPPDDQTRAILENNGYEGTRYRLRAWWQPSWELDTTEGNEGARGYLRYLKKMLVYMAYRDIYPPDIGSTDFMLYRRAPVEAASRAGDGAAKPPEEQPRLPDSIVTQDLAGAQIIGGPGQGPGQFQQPRGMAVGPDGSLYVVDSMNDRIERFGPGGELLGTFGSNGSGDGQFNKPGGICVDRSGFVYVADVWNHRIQKFTANGEFVLAWGKEPDFYGPRDVVVTQDNRVFVTDTGHHKVVCYTDRGEYIREWGVKGTRYRQFTEPVGMALGADGTLYVADTGNRRIQAFDTEGKFLRSFAVAGWEYIYSEPYLTIDSNERLWLTDSKNNRIQAYTNHGKYLGALGGPSQLQGPIGVTVDAHGTLYIADTGNHRVVKVALGGQPIPAR
jgi:uncharacterized protein (TIGR03663 family)